MSVRSAGRSTSNVRLLNLDTDDKVAIATVIPRRPQSKRPVGTLLQYPPLLFGPHMYMSPQRRREEDRPCLICGRNAGWNEDPRISAAMITCDLCGRFRFNSITELYLGGPAFQEDLRRYKVSYALRTTAESTRGMRDNSRFPIYSQEDFVRQLEAPEPT